MNINSAFPSKYLKASDLGEAQPVVTIDHVAMEEVGQKKEKRPVLYFQGKDKGVVLNRTNSNKIVEILGSADTDEWEGQRIKLYASTTSFAGEEVECIRVKAAGNGKASPIKMSKPAPEPEPEPAEEFASDEIPF